jgi:hypothetical protein
MFERVKTGIFCGEETFDEIAFYFRGLQETLAQRSPAYSIHSIHLHIDSPMGKKFKSIQIVDLYSSTGEASLLPSSLARECTQCIRHPSRETRGMRKEEV